MKKRNRDHMEQDILEAAYNLGSIYGESSALKALLAKYPAQETGRSRDLNSPEQQLTVVINYLLEERYLYPFFTSDGEEVRHGRARGITPKGIERLHRLQHPTATWLKNNWFPVVVATITACIGILSIVLK